MTLQEARNQVYEAETQLIKARVNLEKSIRDEEKYHSAQIFADSLTELGIPKNKVKVNGNTVTILCGDGVSAHLCILPHGSTVTS